MLAFDPDEPPSLVADDAVHGFDLRDDVSPVRSDWPAASNPWLAMDRDGDGRIGSGRELFGTATPVGDRSAAHGFEALAELDEDGNGRIDSADTAFRRLVLWSDADGDRASAEDELRSLEAAGIVSLDVAHRVDALSRDPYAWDRRAGLARA